MEIEKKLFKIAYKKLKSSLYYDRTQTILRDKLVEFESETKNVEEALENLAKQFSNKKTRVRLIEGILSGINNYVFPKKIESEINEQERLIKNYSSKTLVIEENQFFIDMDIRGHILGVLWLMIIGYKVDKDIYVHSYGNRIRKNLINEFSDEPTYSPYLFEPYFQQYESWRDTAMNEAVQHLHDNQDVIVLTLDFKRFYYSVDITKTLFENIFIEVYNKSEQSDEIKDLHQFVYMVIEKYSECCEESGGRNILPIGFLPSNVLANYALRNFDKAILDGWNPIYFGRYVDDVIIVEKVEKTSELYMKSQNNELTAKDVIELYLLKCSSWNGLSSIGCSSDKKYALLKEEESLEKTGESNYILNKQYNPSVNDDSRIVVKDEKMKVFYFKAGESDALITCFRENISKNKSEFRHMPEDEAVFQKDDFSKVYDLKNNETINKFRGISGIEIDKYELSKLLGKHLRIGGLIHDTKEMGFEKQILKILNPLVVIENYNVWEKILELLVINESWNTLKEVVKIIVSSIGSLEYNDRGILFRVKKSLSIYLCATINRSFALVWGERIEELIDEIADECIDKTDQSLCDYLESDNTKRKAYCYTRMVDKSVIPILVDMLDLNSIYNTRNTISLCSFHQMLDYCKMEWDNKYIYYPYLITMYDFSIASCIEQLKVDENAFSDLELIHGDQVTKYNSYNYLINDNRKEIDKVIKVENIEGKNAFYVRINNEKKDRLKIAIANVRINHDNFMKVVTDNPNRSYNRYMDLSRLVNAAIDEKADMLIMPEAYIPFEWLPVVARTCARNNLAIISGVEHLKYETNVYNLTAIILPYEDTFNKSALLSFHLKKHYSPAEKQEINGYGLNEVTGDRFELYHWHDCFFPVYCCYELASISERAQFQSYADFLVAIEWNRDTNYYSNILESLSRDIHCYCVQVNSSDYGDSRITKPSKTEKKDIVRTKGGNNTTILIGEINIGKIREYQIKGYDLQAYDKEFKPTPPGFDSKIVLRKIKGEDLFKNCR